MRNETYPLIDTCGACHLLQIQDDQLALDQHQVLSICQVENLVIFATDDGQEIACLPEACWYAIAGADAAPTATEAGRLLAAHLAHWNDEQRLRTLVQSLSRLVDDEARALILPQPRLDPFIEAALARCEEQPPLSKVEALAQVLDQPPALVMAWLKLRGKTVLLPEEAPEAADSDDGRAGDVDVEEHEAQAAPTKRLMFRWSSERIALLTAEFLATPLDQSVSSAAKAIAERHQWPAESTEYKIYHLDLPQKRLAQQSSSASLKEDGEQDQPGAQVESADLASLEAAPSPEVNASGALQLTEPEKAQPVELCRGNFVWDVRVDGAVQRWFLDYPYGAFPVQEGLVVYQGTTYALQMVGINTVRATSVQQSTQMETKASEVLKVG
jgi:hypothetical protein